MKNHGTIPYTVERQLQLAGEADVIVCGGGPGGIGAAVMAARSGARTLLVERYGQLGGMASHGEVHPFMRNHLGEEALDQPVYTEWIDRMERYWPRQEADNPRGIHKEAAMLAAEDLCRDAGVELLFHHSVADVIRSDSGIEQVVLISKSGFSAVQGAVYVDCTGDADVAAAAGCEFEIGGPSGHCQPMTLCFKLCRVDRDRMPPRAEITSLYVQARERGEIDCPRENVLMFNWLEPDVIHFNTTRVIHHLAVNGVELSEAEMIARKQMRQIIDFLRAHVAGFEKARLFSVANHVGIRESRRVRGLHYLTREAFENRQKFPDGIARVRYCIDIHNPDGTGTEIVSMPENEWYEIPYGCLVARDCDNLLIGGRPISVDHAIHSSMRIMPPAVSVGQAAGAGAAICVRETMKPRDLDGRSLRRVLKDLGANL